MKTFLYALTLVVIVVVVTTLAVKAPELREDLQEGRPPAPESLVYSSHGYYKEDYIAFLKRTARQDSVEAMEELQRRIRAVEKMSHWP